MLTIVYFILFFSLFGVNDSYAQGQESFEFDDKNETRVHPLYGLEMGYFSTSDRLRGKKLGLHYETSRLNPFWPYKNQKSKSYFFKINWLSLDSSESQITLDRGQSYKPAQGLRLSSGIKWDSESGYFFLLEAGADVVRDNLGNSSSVNGTLALTGLIYSDDTYWLSLKLASELLYPRVLPLRGDLLSTKAQVIEPALRWRFHQRLQFDGKFQWALLKQTMNMKERNQRLQSDFQLMWGVQTYPHWFWLGLGFEEIKNSEISLEYWSPDRFRAVGLRLDSAFEVVADWQIFAGFSLNRIQENQESWGSGYYIRAGLQQGERNEHLIRLYYEGSSSLQRGSSWSSHGIGFSANF